MPGSVSNLVVPKPILGFIGLDKKLQFIHASGLAMSDVKEQAKMDAQDQINALLTSTNDDGA